MTDEINENGFEEMEETRTRPSESWSGWAWKKIGNVMKKAQYPSTAVYSLTNSLGYITQLLKTILNLPLDEKSKGGLLISIGLSSVPLMESNIRSTLKYLKEYHEPELKKIPYCIKNETVMKASVGISSVVKTIGTTISFSALLENKKAPVIPDWLKMLLIISSAYGNIVSTAGTLSYDPKEKPSTQPAEIKNPRNYDSLPSDDKKSTASNSWVDWCCHWIPESLRKGNVHFINAISTLTATLFYFAGTFQSLEDLVENPEKAVIRDVLLTLSVLLSLMSWKSNYNSNETSLKKIHRLPTRSTEASLFDKLSANSYALLKAIGGTSFALNFWNLVQPYLLDNPSKSLNEFVDAILVFVFVFNFHATVASANRGKRPDGQDQLPAEITSIAAMGEGEQNRHYEDPDVQDVEDIEDPPAIGQVPTTHSINSGSNQSFVSYHSSGKLSSQ